MDLAIEIIKDQISHYDYCYRDCSKYFMESESNWQKRKDKLKNQRDQLKRVLEIIINDNSGLNIDGVIKSVCLKCGSTDFIVQCGECHCLNCGEPHKQTVL